MWRNAEAVADQLQGVEPDGGPLLFNGLDGGFCKAKFFGKLGLGFIASERPQIFRQVF